MDFKNRIKELSEIRKVRKLKKEEISELIEYRRDIISLSLAAYMAEDWDWLHDICKVLGEVDSLLLDWIRDIYGDLAAFNFLLHLESFFESSSRG
jgi:hypothetical protein